MAMGHPHELFQSTLPVWGATADHAQTYSNIIISIHAPRVGSDLFGLTFPDSQRDFNPRSPCGERPKGGRWRECCWIFQSTLPVWGATVHVHLVAHPRKGISIHAPRVGSDDNLGITGTTAKISIHAPRVGSDGDDSTVKTYSVKFQSTLPVWGATKAKVVDKVTAKFQSTLPVWGATSGQERLVESEIRISIHAPRVGSDNIYGHFRSRSRNFNPRSPCGERLDGNRYYKGGEIISIHAPRVGSDSPRLFTHSSHSISIHAPRVGSDFIWTGYRDMRRISIHAPRVGSDLGRGWSQPERGDFNPRSPCGERPWCTFSLQATWRDFNPRSPCGERLRV